MERRRFFLYMLGLTAWLWDGKRSLGRHIFAAWIPQERETLTIYPRGQGGGETLSLWWRRRTPFVSLSELAEALKVHTYFNPDKRKMVLYFPGNKVVISADNPFVLVDSKTFQMPVETVWRRDQIFVPIRYLTDLLSQFTFHPFDYDPGRQEMRQLQEKQSEFSVTSVEVDSRENGIMIRIKTSQKFKPSEMSIDQRNDWLHVDLYGATANVNQMSQTAPVANVREVKAFQFQQLLSLGFRMRKMPESRELYQDEITGDVLVVLRYPQTSTDRQPQQVTEKRPGRETGDDLRRQLDDERKKWLIDTIVIDPGHGGKDPGAVGVGSLKEKDVVLAIGLKLGTIIERKMPGVRVVYTRNTDTFVELRKRTQIANENNGKLFLSIHANANRSSRAAGFETYILGPEKGEQARNVVERENAVIQFEDPNSQRHYDGINNILATMAQSAFMRHSEQLAARVQKEMANRLTRLSMKNRGVKQAPFWVMVGASMPAILVETGFITNAHEARILKTTSHQQKMAEGIFTGLVQFKEEYESAI